MSYIGLGSRGPVIASADTTGFNTGNFTCSFSPAVLNTNVAYFEVYHFVVANVPVGASAQITINNKPWGFTYPLQGSEWNPPQPMLLNPTDQIDFLWSIVSSGSQAPTVTAWLRYDPDIQPVMRAMT